MALVSVIIPYYKKINHIKKTLNSVLDQTFQDFEIIIIYDDVNLNDLNFIEELVKNNRKIKLIKNAKNLGAGLSRNIGIQNSTGKIIAFLDSDDYWDANRLEKQIKFMMDNNYKFTFCNYKKVINNKKINVLSKKKAISYKQLLNDCEIGLSTVFLDRDIIEENLFPPLKTKEDYVAWLKITKKNVCAYNFSESLVEWNYSEKSLSSNFFQKLQDGFKVYFIYQDMSFLKSLFYLLLLSLNSIKRKI